MEIIEHEDDFEIENEEPTETLEETILKSIEEVEAKNEKPEADKPYTGQQGKDDPESEIKKAARTLANAKKGKKKVVEGSELEQEPAQTEAANELVEQTKLEAPQRWPVQDKEEFNKLPEVAKRQVVDFWNGIESHTTKLWQDLNREKTRYTEANQIVDYYVPKWNLQGLTPTQAMAEMFAMQDHIINDPFAAYSLMLQKSGISLEQLYEYQQNGGQVLQQPQQNNYQEQNNFLTKEDFFESMQEWQQSQVEQREIMGAAQQVQSVKDEVSADGRYLWPELHDINTIERVKPLVDDLMKTQPGISWADATKKAVSAIRHLSGNFGSPSQTGSRLPYNNQQQINKIKAASVSVSGRGNASRPTFEPAPENESVEETLRRTIAGLTNQY